MIIVDAHCDTITKIMEEKSRLYSNSSHIDLKRLGVYGEYVQFFAAFIDPAFGNAYAMKRAVEIIDKFYREIKENEQYIKFCTQYKDICDALDSDKVAAILSIEGGDALQGSIEALRTFYRLGVRSICLTWNYRNEIADGVKDSDSKGGLTPFGKEVVKEMNSLGMIVDVSHISESGFWDVIQTTSYPIIASHSNARKICSHMRNLTDEQLVAIKNNGGVAGINLYPDFISNRKEANLKDIINHIEHIMGITGTDHIGIGADFDGIERVPDDIRGVEDLYKIFNELQRLNYPQETIEKFAGRNFLRVIEKIMV